MNSSRSRLFSLSGLLLGSALLLVGCGNDPPGPAQGVDQGGSAIPLPNRDATSPVRAPAITPRDDPAMLEPLTPPAGEDAPVAAAPQPRLDPERFRIDQENQRLYLPGSGWMSIDSFWQLYFNQPERLPPDLDHRLLEPIRPR